MQATELTFTDQGFDVSGRFRSGETYRVVVVAEHRRHRDGYCEDGYCEYGISVYAGGLGAELDSGNWITTFKHELPKGNSTAILMAAERWVIRHPDAAISAVI